MFTRDSHRPLTNICPSDSRIEEKLFESCERALPGALGVYTRNGYRVQMGEYFWGYIEAGKEGTSRGSQVAEWVRRQAEEARGNTPEGHIGTAICGMQGAFLGDGEHEITREWPLTITAAPDVPSTNEARGSDGRFALERGADNDPQAMEQNKIAGETLGSLVADNGFGVHIAANYCPSGVTLQGLNFETVKSVANMIEELSPDQRIVGQPGIFVEGYSWRGPAYAAEMKNVATFRTMQPPSSVPRQLGRKDANNHFRLYRSSHPGQRIADKLNAEFRELSTPEAAPDGRGFITLQYYTTPSFLYAGQQEEYSHLTKDQQLYNAWATFLNWMNDHPGVGIEEAYLTITENPFNTFIKGGSFEGGEDWRCYRLVVRFRDNTPDKKYTRKSNSRYPLDEEYNRSLHWPDVEKYVLRHRKLCEPLRDGWTTTDGFGMAMLEGILPIVDNISITYHQRNIDRWFTNWLFDHPNYEIVQCVPGGTTGQVTLTQAGRGPYYPPSSGGIEGFRQQMPVFFIDRDIAEGRKKPKDVIELPVDIDAHTLEIRRTKRFKRINGRLDADLDDILLYGDTIPRLHRDDFKRAAQGHFAGDIGVAGFLGVYASEGDGLPPSSQQFCFIASVINHFEKNNWGYLDSSWLLSFDSHHYSYAKGKSFGNTLEAFLFRLIARVYKRSPDRPNRSLKTEAVPQALPREADSPASAIPDIPALDGVSEEVDPQPDDGDDTSSWGDRRLNWD